MNESATEFHPDCRTWPRVPFNHYFLLAAALIICCLLSGCATVNHSSSEVAEQPALTVPVPDSATLSVAGECRQEQLELSVLPLPEEIDDSGQEVDEGTPSEPEATIAQEIADLKNLADSTEDSSSSQPEETDENNGFPVTVNRQVEYYLDFFQNRQHASFSRWLERSGRYLPMIRQELQQAGLPAELAYLPLIESGFNLSAYSRAHAVGPWQFIKSTGRNYGLTINRYIDERRDIVASTRAAVQFLQELHEEFGSWYLAVAGYNAGQGTIRRAIQKTGSDNFWKIAQSRYLRPETKLYVPKLIAAILIARAPGKYGFTDLDYASPLAFESVEVPPWTPLQAVALACDADFDEIRELNRELGKAITPPTSTYSLKVPAGKGQLVEQQLDRVRAVVRTSYKDHIVSNNESLAQICRKYHLNTITLLKANNLRKSRLRSGQHLRIPVQTTEYRLLAADAPAGAAEGEELILHRVRPGETLSAIARKYGVSIQQLASWNGIRDPRRIRAGSQLALYLENSLFESNSERNSVLSALAKEKPSADKGKKTITYYDVQEGDSLWKIARKYQLTTDQIRQWNDLKGDMIRPGNRLMLKLLVADEDA